MHGEKAKRVDVFESKKILDCYQNVELNILEKEPHKFTRFGRRRARGLSCDFINKIIHRL